MLTADLVQARVGRTFVEPRSIDTGDAETLDLARTLIGIFEEKVGRRRGELDAELSDLLGTGTEFLLHRGLAKLLYDRAEFGTDAALEPSGLREKVFAGAARAYRSTAPGPVDRDAVLRLVAAELGLREEELERFLYADLKEEQVLLRFRSSTPEWLLERYNVALVQGVLCRATSLTIEIRGERAARYREIFRSLKFFRLLHRVEGDAARGFRIAVDGPLSLFKSSHRYGANMAAFLPSLLACEGWKLEADVVWGKKRLERKLVLTHGDGLKPYRPPRGQWMPEEVSWLFSQFPKLESEWEISAAAEGSELVDLGGQGVLIPDFVFSHRPSGKKVYMEVLGFWRRGAVASRLRLLRERGPENLILAVSKDLSIEEGDLSGLPGEVYVFRNAPVAREVLEKLEALVPSVT